MPSARSSATSASTTTPQCQPRDVRRVDVLALADERADGIGTKKNWSYFHRDFVRLLRKFLGRKLNSRTNCKTCLISSKQLSNSKQFLAASAWLECRSCNIASLGAGITYRLLLQYIHFFKDLFHIANCVIVNIKK